MQGGPDTRWCAGGLTRLGLAASNKVHPDQPATSQEERHWLRHGLAAAATATAAIATDALNANTERSQIAYFFAIRVDIVIFQLGSVTR